MVIRGRVKMNLVSVRHHFLKSLLPHLPKLRVLQLALIKRYTEEGLVRQQVLLECRNACAANLTSQEGSLTEIIWISQPASKKG